MDRYQNSDLLGMVGRGTLGGERRADGSDLESGVHLRWQTSPELGFPPGGFDLYRRPENNGHYWSCGVFRQADVVGVAWVPADDDHIRPGVGLTFDGAVHIGPGCDPGASNAAIFPGERVVRLSFEQSVRIVRLRFGAETSSNPMAEAFSASATGLVRVARERAQRRGPERVVTLYADRIDQVVLHGVDLVLCELCFVLLREGRDLFWPQIPLNGGTPIYLPITHPVWGSPHPHSPDDQAEARARLPAGLPPDKRQAYLSGFRDELQPILYDLVDTDPQCLYRLRNADDGSAATLDWPGLNLLQVLALDPNLARILGQYWRDQPPSNNAFFDYRVVAHYGDQPYPGKRFDFTELELGRRYGPIVQHKGLTFVSPNPIEAALTTWAGTEHTALRINREITVGPVAITLPEPTRATGTRSVTLHLVTEHALTAAAYLGTKQLDVQVKAAGEVTLVFEETAGIDRIQLYPLGRVDLVSLILREETGPLGDLVYDVFHIRANSRTPQSRPALEPPRVTAAPTGLDPQGRAMSGQTRVDLRWAVAEAGGDFLLPDAPVFYLVERIDLADDGATVLAKRILNATAPTLISQRAHSEAGPVMYSDRGVADGQYRYAVRGIDVFGVLGDWGPSQSVAVHDRLAPPPPQAVQAQYLDPGDPWLSTVDKDWALANGSGVKLRWQWPGMFALQAPDVAEPLGEFRAYFEPGALNRLDGQVTGLATSGSTSTLTTDIAWPGSVDALAGLSLRVNQNFFVVNAHTSGANCVFTVAHLTLPDLAPTSGPCSLTIPRDHAAWRDYARAANWQRRLAIAPAAAPAAVDGQVLAVGDFDPEAVDAPVVTRPGATRTITLDQGLEDPDGMLLPGALLCDGVVYQVYGHALGPALRLHLAPMPAAASSATLVEPPVAARCTYYPGRQYELRVAGVDLSIAAGQASAVAHMALTSSDGQPETGDNPIWSRPGRGDLGQRPGNESALSLPARMEAMRRTGPAAVANIPAAPAEPIIARPANYFGQARYTLTWEAVSEAAGYAVYRTAGSALFAQDRLLRQGRKGAYATGSVFADDPGFVAWLAAYDPTLTETQMLADVAGYLDVWRAWAARFYAGLTDAEIQTLAGRSGNDAAFRRITPDPVTGTSHADTFDGRGQGFYVYRVRTIDAAGNLSPWPEALAFPPVHIFNVTPPATPALSTVTGGHNQITLRWAHNANAGIKGYRLYRASNPEAVSGWRRMEWLRSAETDAYTVAVDGAPSGSGIEYADIAVEPLQPYWYTLVAVGADGNGADLASRPSAAVAGQAYDLTPPEPPQWDASRSGWVYVDDAGVVFDWEADLAGALNPRPAIRLAWSIDPRQSEVLIARDDPLLGRRVTVGAWAAGTPLDATRLFQLDRQVDPALTYAYSGKARSLAGLLSATDSSIHIPPAA